jgi:hypothetical protein
MELIGDMEERRHLLSGGKCCARVTLYWPQPGLFPLDCDNENTESLTYNFQGKY